MTHFDADVHLGRYGMVRVNNTAFGGDAGRRGLHPDEGWPARGHIFGGDRGPSSNLSLAM
jgi:hypothetical protein